MTIAAVPHRLRGLCLALLLTTVLLAPAGSRAAPGAIASPDRYGADTAAEILKAGGNAVDAAVAVALTLAVTYPEAGNLGGGGLATIYFGGKTYFLDYREMAPKAARADMYLDPQGKVIPDASTIGARAVAVPGTAQGLWEMHRKFGVLPWKRLFVPALRYARQGFVVDRQLAAGVAEYTKTLAGRTNFVRYFGGATASGVLRQPELAATLARVQRQGPDGFYKGATARLITAEMQRDGGLISGADLAAYHAVWRTPLEADWAGYRVVTAPPPSSGGIALVQLLEMKAAVAPLFRAVPLNSPQYVHLVAELEKRVFADRAEYLGDPDFVSVPVAALTSAAYLEGRAYSIRVDRPTTTEDVGPGLPEHHNTTHFSVIDGTGNAVSNTYTLNDEFGSGVVVQGGGFLLNNEMDDFSAKPGTANIYGVVGGAANAIAPGKRPLSSMTPTILTHEGKVALVIGTPGGSRIFTSVFQVICNWHDLQLSLKDAVAAARFHHQLLPANLIYEEPYKLLDPETVRALEARGYQLENQGWNGDIQAIELAPHGPVVASDPRGRGVAEVIAAEPRAIASGAH